MRLIDANALKSIIDPREQWILELIDEMPTAVSVEEIIKILNSEKYSNSEKYKHNRKTQDNMCMYNQGINRAISIIKEKGEL